MDTLLSRFILQHGIKRPGDVRWSHAVNSREKLERFLQDKQVLFIESDIRVSRNGTIVTAHPPETESDLTFDELISGISTSTKGLKLDFKDPEVLIPCLERLKKSDLSQPVFLNADILQGNGANPSKFSAVSFIALCKKYYPEGILSLGWTTTADPNLSYTKEIVDEMLRLCEGIPQVTFPVRACLLPNSWEQVSRLIEDGGYTLTVWNNEPIDTVLKNWIQNNTNPEKTFYDFIDEEKNPLQLW